MPNRQEFHSDRVTLYSNGNALTMLILSGQGSLEILTRLAADDDTAENFKERRGYAISDHLKDDTNARLPSAR